MARVSSAFSHISVVLLLVFLVFIHGVHGQSPIDGPTPTIIVFGDSTADPGNNNYINTWDKSNFWPYGVDFPFGVATGRFTNAFLMTDIAATYLRGDFTIIKAFLDPSLSLEDMKQGVSFASAGSGYDPDVAQADGALSLPQQLDNFSKYQAQLEASIGANETQKLVKEAICVVSISTNDIFDYWFGLTKRKQSLNVPNYQQFMISQFKNFMQALLDQGAKNFFVIGAPPVGHLPESITFQGKSANSTGRQPVEALTTASDDFNKMLKKELQTMQTGLVNHTIFYGDIYGAILDIVTNPAKHGYKVVDKGCCGTGLQEYGMLCTLSALRYGICSNRSEYFFWDGVHPTQRGYQSLFDALKPTIDAFMKNLTR
ncbi:hypothetical protein Droror1_Dr00010366 [Drosera rotundifolia]